MTDTIDRDADDVLAGELSLRILPEAEEATARDREQNDPAFAGRVARWNDDLARLADEVAPVRPSEALWARIAASAFGGVAANDNGKLAFWRRWAIGSTGLLAASLAALAVLVAQPDPVPEPVAPQGGVTRVATLTLESGTAAVTLAYDAGTGHLFLSPKIRRHTPNSFAEVASYTLWNAARSPCPVLPSSMARASRVITASMHVLELPDGL